MIKNSIIMKSFHSCQLQIMVLSHFQVVNLFNKKIIYIQQWLLRRCTCLLTLGTVLYVMSNDCYCAASEDLGS